MNFKHRVTITCVKNKKHPWVVHHYQPYNLNMSNPSNLKTMKERTHLGKAFQLNFFVNSIHSLVVFDKLI